MRQALIVMIALLTVPGCVLAPPFYWGEELHARVIDEDTGKPLQGVVVLANWELYSGGTGHGSHGGSLLVNETLTDSDGTFRFVKWGPTRRPAHQILDYAPSLVFFKRGYEHRYLQNESPSNGFVRRSDWSGHDIALKRFEGDAATRAHTIRLVLSMSALQPLMLQELLAEKERYPTWPGDTYATFSHIAKLLKKGGINVPEAR